MRIVLSAVAAACCALAAAGPAAAAPIPVDLRVEGANGRALTADRYFTDSTRIKTAKQPPTCNGSGKNQAARRRHRARRRSWTARSSNSRLDPLLVSDEFSFGLLVCGIGGTNGNGSSSFWLYKVNHVAPEVGADAFAVKPSDDVLWYFVDGARNSGDELELGAPPRVQPGQEFDVHGLRVRLPGRASPRGRRDRRRRRRHCDDRCVGRGSPHARPGGQPDAARDARPEHPLRADEGLRERGPVEVRAGARKPYLGQPARRVHQRHGWPGHGSRRCRQRHHRGSARVGGPRALRPRQRHRARGPPRQGRARLRGGSPPRQAVREGDARAAADPGARRPRGGGRRAARRARPRRGSSSSSCSAAARRSRGRPAPRQATVTVAGRRCAVGDGTALAALVRSRPGRLRLRDFGACSTRPRDSAGLLVTGIRSDRNRGQRGWVYKVGRRAATAGAGDMSGPFGRGRLRAGQRVTWFYCVRAADCQRTLELTAAPIGGRDRRDRSRLRRRGRRRARSRAPASARPA